VSEVRRRRPGEGHCSERGRELTAAFLIKAADRKDPLWEGPKVTLINDIAGILSRGGAGEPCGFPVLQVYVPILPSSGIRLQLGKSYDCTISVPILDLMKLSQSTIFPSNRITSPEEIISPN
jgi:hypothetical protein